MGCAASSIDKEERVRICKERKRVMKKLLGFRGEFANAVLAYLRALKNTGVTLRQFTESETLEVDNGSFSSELPPSPPYPLPPSPPPPPPPYSPDSRKLEGIQNAEEPPPQEEIIENGDDSGCTPPPPPVLSSSWDFSDLFEKSSIQHGLESSRVEEADEDNWAETKSQFEDEDQEQIAPNRLTAASRNDQLNLEMVGDDSLMVNGRRKNLADVSMVMCRRSKKTLPGIVTELDDYFLKASAGGSEIAVLVDLGARNTSLHHDFRESKAKGNNSARVLGSLSWSWSSRSGCLTRDAVEAGGHIEPCRPGAHCITLDKLYAEEQILYKAVREEEVTKLEHQRKSVSLQRQEDENVNSYKIEKTRAAVENLEFDIVRLQELVRQTCSSLLVLIDEELHPQLVALLSGMIHLWKTMYECHKVQCVISQQVENLASQPSSEPTSENHRDATVQLENEVNFWYNSFCRLVKCQREYVNALLQWIQLTDCLLDTENRSQNLLTVRKRCEKWQLVLDRLPEKAMSEAIMTFLLAIRSIMLQQEEEYILKKKSEKLERRLHKELNLLVEMERKLEESATLGDMESGLRPRHPLSVKRAKADALKKRYENEKAKYLSSVQASRAMTLNNLHTCLPNVFQALMGFSSACFRAFEIALSYTEQVSDVDQSHAET